MKAGGRLLDLKMLNNAMNNLQIDPFKNPEQLINLALPKRFDKRLSLSRPWSLDPERA
jgi:hypothetical protein